MKEYVCDPDVQGHVPAVAVLRKIERELTKHAYEHVLFYIDKAKTQQAWQWVKRGQGKAQQWLNRYYQGQSSELLVQWLERLLVDMNEEGSIYTAEMLDLDRVFAYWRLVAGFGAYGRMGGSIWGAMTTIWARVFLTRCSKCISMPIKVASLVNQQAVRPLSRLHPRG